VVCGYDVTESLVGQPVVSLMMIDLCCTTPASRQQTRRHQTLYQLVILATLKEMCSQTVALNSTIDVLHVCQATNPLTAQAASLTTIVHIRQLTWTTLAASPSTSTIQWLVVLVWTQVQMAEVLVML